MVNVVTRASGLRGVQSCCNQIIKGTRYVWLRDISRIIKRAMRRNSTNSSFSKQHGVLTLFSFSGFSVRPVGFVEIWFIRASHKYNELFYPISDRSISILVSFAQKVSLCLWWEQSWDREAHPTYNVRILLSLIWAPPITPALHWHPLPWQWPDI